MTAADMAEPFETETKKSGSLALMGFVGWQFARAATGERAGGCAGASQPCAGFSLQSEFGVAGARGSSGGDSLSHTRQSLKERPASEGGPYIFVGRSSSSA